MIPIPISPHTKLRIDVVIRPGHADVGVVLDERYALSVDPIPVKLSKVKAVLDALGVDHVWTEQGGIVADEAEGRS